MKVPSFPETIQANNSGHHTDIWYLLHYGEAEADQGGSAHPSKALQIAHIDKYIDKGFNQTLDQLTRLISQHGNLNEVL